MRSSRLKAGAVLATLAVIGGVGTAQAAGWGPSRTRPSVAAVTAAAGDFTVAYTVSSAWNGGFVADVRLTNDGTSAVSGWTVGWTYPASGQRVVSAWSAQVTQSGPAVTARNASFNGTLAAGASVSFGLQGTFSGSNPSPVSFTVNGSGGATTTTTRGATTTTRGGTTTSSTRTTSRTTTSTATRTTSRTTSTTRPTTTTGPSGGWSLPKANAGFDYQIGTPYDLPSGVTVVSRDHSAPSAGPDVYSVCYVNGYQAQEDALSWWEANHPDVLLRRNGKVVIDADWDEALLDYSTDAKRSELAGVVGGWMDECRSSRFQAVEVDNLDSYTRSGGLLTQSQAIAYAKLLAQAAHGRGLAIAQKNALDLGKAGKQQAGFDFAVAEECADYEITDGVAECKGYTDVYGDLVFAIEYSKDGFDRACREYGDRISVVRRDVKVTAPGSKTYVFGSC